MPDALVLLATPTEDQWPSWLSCAERVLNAPERARLALYPDLLGAGEHAVSRALAHLLATEGVWRGLSVAHDRRTVAVAACRAGRVGVDVERTGALTGDPLALARRFFDPSEADELGRTPPAHRAQWFTRAWTIKEAVAKALGLRLATALRGAVVGTCREGLALRALPAAAALPARALTVHQMGLADGTERLAVAITGASEGQVVLRALNLRAFARALEGGGLGVFG